MGSLLPNLAKPVHVFGVRQSIRLGEEYPEQAVPHLRDVFVHCQRDQGPVCGHLHVDWPMIGLHSYTLRLYGPDNFTQLAMLYISVLVCMFALLSQHVLCKYKNREPQTRKPRPQHSTNSGREFGCPGYIARGYTSRKLHHES